MNKNNKKFERPSDSILTRKRDIIIRIADWTKNKDCPAYDVETYAHGNYLQKHSEVFEIRDTVTKAQAQSNALAFAKAQLTLLLK